MRQKKNSMLLNHAGISLVELIIVIAIISIMVGAAGIGLSLVFSRDSESCAKTIESALETTRMNSMAQGGTFTMHIDTATRMVEVNSSVRGRIFEERLPQRVTVTLVSLGGTVDLTGVTELDVEFDKASGRVIRINTGGTSVDGTQIEFQCVSDQGKNATVILARATGKHFMEYR